jgi:hypothetical protein
MRTPADDLAREAVGAIDSERWGHFAAAESLSQRSEQWTDVALIEALENLWREVIADDQARGRQGRDSNRFEFYDTGLAVMLEVLRERVPPSTR